MGYSLSEACGCTWTPPHNKYGILYTGFTGCLSPLCSAFLSPPLLRFRNWLLLYYWAPSLFTSLLITHITLPIPPPPLSLSHSALCTTVYRVRERIYEADMAAPKFSFGFGVVAVVATLILALFTPLAVRAQSLAPAPAPSSDGNHLTIPLFLDLILYTQATAQSVSSVNLNAYIYIIQLINSISVCICFLWFPISITVVSVWVWFGFRDVDWSRDCVCADGVGSGAHLHHPLRGPLLRHLNLQQKMHASWCFWVERGFYHVYQY